MQKEVELNNEELAKKEWERKKAEAQLESKYNLDVLFHDQVSLLHSVLCSPNY